MYRITLRSVGNPDFGQDPYQPMSPTEESTPSASTADYVLYAAIAS